MELQFERVDWEFHEPFRIAYKTRSKSETVWVQVHDGSHLGRGECLGVSYLGESIQSILDQLQSVSTDVKNGLSREALQGLLPAGGARNALDCALWDLEAKRQGKRAWRLAGLPDVHSVESDFTLGIDEPGKMGAVSAALNKFRRFKIKLAGDRLDLDRVRSVRAARPDAEITVDANQSLDIVAFENLVHELAALSVAMIEQPLPAGADGGLLGFKSPVPICADESCQTSASIPYLLGKYSLINIKLDKTGGLTEALALAEAAKANSLGLMTGCMAGSSLSMAPAFLIAQSSRFIDLDGPLLAKSDVDNAIQYDGGWMSVPAVELWG